jgi:hypothetical protein
MEEQEGFSTNKAPRFDGSEYVFWKIRMQEFFMSLGYDVWDSVVNGYKAPNTPPTDTTEIRLSNNNSRAINVILCGLTKSSIYQSHVLCLS